VLSGILIYIGLGIIDWKYISRFPFVPRGGVLIMITVWFVALFDNVVTGAAIGFVMACLGAVKRIADIQLESIEVSDAVREGSRLDQAEQTALERSGQKTLLINLSGPVTFGAANRLYRRLANIAAYRSIVLDFSNVPHIDESGIIALENIIRAAHDHDQLVLLSSLSRDLARSIIRFGLTPLLKECPRYGARLQALEAAAEHALEE
jgi:SulP family sulfate permease